MTPTASKSRPSERGGGSVQLSNRTYPRYAETRQYEPADLAGFFAQRGVLFLSSQQGNCSVQTVMASIPEGNKGAAI